MVQKISMHSINGSFINAGETKENCAETTDLTSSNVKMVSDAVEKSNYDNAFGNMGLELNGKKPDIPPTIEQQPAAVSLPKVCGKFTADYNEAGLPERIYENGKLKFDDIAYDRDGKVQNYRVYEYDSKGHQTKEIFHDMEENVAYLRILIERDDNGKRTRTIEYQRNGEPRVWWEHEYRFKDDADRMDYECHYNGSREFIGWNQDFFND